MQQGLLLLKCESIQPLEKAIPHLQLCHVSQKSKASVWSRALNQIDVCVHEKE